MNVKINPNGNRPEDSSGYMELKRTARIIRDEERPLRLGRIRRRRNDRGRAAALRRGSFDWAEIPLAPLVPVSLQPSCSLSSDIPTPLLS